MSFHFPDIKKKYDIKWSIITFICAALYGLFMIQLFEYLSVGLATFIVLIILILWFPMVAGKIKGFLLGALIFSLPLNLDRAFYHTEHLGGAAGIMVSIYDITLLLLYFFWICEILRKKDVSINFFPSISIPAIFFIIIAFLSMLKASHKNLCIFETIEIIKMYLGFFYFANNIKSEKDVRFVIFCLLASLFGEGVLGLSQFSTGETYLPSGLGYRSNLAYYKSSCRVSGTWRSYNDFAWYLTYLIPVSLSLFFYILRPIYMLVNGIVLGVGIGALLSTLSRAGYISFIMSTLIVILLTFRKVRGKTKLVNFFGSLIIVVNVILVFFAMNPSSLKLAKNRMFYDDDRGSAESRIPQIKIAYSIIRANPLTGVGINNYTEVVQSYDTKNELAEITNYQVHNIFLQIGAEMGIPGLIVFLWLVFAIFREGFKCIKISDDFMQNVVIGLIAGIWAFLIHGLVDCHSIGGNLFVFLWLFAGIISAIKELSKNKRYESRLELIR